VRRGPLAARAAGLVTAAAALLLASSAAAHKGSDVYWTLRAAGPVATGHLDVALKDLEFAVGLDADEDGQVTWGELRTREAELHRFLSASVAVAQGGAGCPLTWGELAVTRHSDGAYAVFPVTVTCPAPLAEVQVRYALLFDADATHRGLLSVSAADGGQWLAFTAGRQVQAVRFEALGRGAQAWRALGEGVHHIAIGWDHLAFLFALLLPSVLRREAGQWVPREGLRAALLDVTKVVTAFTVAHSVTLALAAFGVVSPDARLVEVAIAVSVALAAFNNLVPFVPETRWSLAFALGLLHGFGFVSAIADLGAEGPSLWLSVLGFNLGVELGQLAIVAAFVPVAWALRTRGLYGRLLLPAASALILGVALFWTSQRL
jgi:hypothetical protein